MINKDNPMVKLTHIPTSIEVLSCRHRSSKETYKECLNWLKSRIWASKHLPEAKHNIIHNYVIPMEITNCVYQNDYVEQQFINEMNYYVKIWHKNEIKD